MKTLIYFLSIILLSNFSQAHDISFAEAIEKLKRENIRKPIIYGVGAAGLTLETTFDESRTMLTPPYRGPFDDGLTLYEEQLIVVWASKSENEGWSALQIIAQTGYLGEMDAGVLGKLQVGSNLSDYIESDKKMGASKLMVDLFNQFEQKDSAYNCLETTECRLIYGSENQFNFVIQLPGALFLMSKQDFKIAEIRIYSPRPN